ncbi:MAG: 50S ribosomal protein L17 [Patescibacteria group bacterium]|nr:MAG: 50S ribosomal protein L17 [Patescibacteria group bacterium]
MRQLLSSLILHGKIVTIEARAKTLKRETERLISRSKRLDIAARRRILSILPEKEAAEKLFDRIIPQFQNRVGGYVRVVKLPHRRGDHAPLARVEFVEEIKEVPSGKKKPKAGETIAKGPARKTSAKNKSNQSKRS